MVGSRRAGEMLSSRIGEAELEAAAVIRIGLSVYQSSPDQCIDRPAYCRSAALNMRCNLIERAWFSRRDR
jgi:hypothetical protein